MTKTAVILGVGPAEGLGTYLAVKAAEEGLHVIVSGRTQTTDACEAVVARMHRFPPLQAGPIDELAHRSSDANWNPLSSVRSSHCDQKQRHAALTCISIASPGHAWTLELDS